MKIKSNDIDRVIEILQQFKGELKGQEYFEFKDNKLVKNSFELPKFFAVRAKDKVHADILYNYFNTTYGHTWRTSNNTHYNIFLNFNIEDGKFNVGPAGQIIEGYTEISADDFIEHIILKGK